MRVKLCVNFIKYCESPLFIEFPTRLNELDGINLEKFIDKRELTDEEIKILEYESFGIMAVSWDIDEFGIYQCAIVETDDYICKEHPQYKSTQKQY